MDRNIRGVTRIKYQHKSLSARRAWIEISRNEHDRSALRVALRKESVDRNADVVAEQHHHQVALRKESVDRNVSVAQTALKTGVALRKESVDRNVGTVSKRGCRSASLSARRAWIEMPCCWCRTRCRVSLSARRAWIEIQNGNYKRLRAGSLSARRAWIEITP